jgi:hypothetical protein
MAISLGEADADHATAVVVVVVVVVDSDIEEGDGLGHYLALEAGEVAKVVYSRSRAHQPCFSRLPSP